MPEESLRLQQIIANAMSRRTFALVQPSKRLVENQEIGTSVGVRWKGQYLLITAGHVLEQCPDDQLGIFLPPQDIQFVPGNSSGPAPVMELRRLLRLATPVSPVFADDPVDLAAIVLPPQPNAQECFLPLDERSVMPANATQVGVFGYPGAAKIPIGEDFIAGPEHFYGPLDADGEACKHEPQQDFTVPYELPHRANGYSGSGVWYWRAEPVWTPESQLCGILASECVKDSIVSGYRIETVIRFLQDNEDLLQR